MKTLTKKCLCAAMLVSLGCFNNAFAQTSKDYHFSDVLNKLDEHLSVHGYAQGGYIYDDQATPDNTFRIDRIVGFVNGKVTNKWDCYFMYSFSGDNKSHALELWTEYHFTPAFNVKIGEFKTPFSIESPLSPTVLAFNTMSQASNYLMGNTAADVKYGSNSGRDQGLQISGDLIPYNDKNLLTYQLAIMNGQGINVSDKNNQKDLVWSLTFHPNQKLDLNVSSMKGKGYALANEYEIKAGDNYTRNRASVGLEYKGDPFEVRTEYIYGKDGNHHSEGYYATAGYHVTPQFDLLASYDYFNKNKDITHQNEVDYKMGVQYWFYPRCRVQLQYTYKDRDNQLDQENNNLVEALVQVRF